MDILQMENILYNLTNLESSFKELQPNVNYNDYQTYQRFLNNLFIRQHKLSTIYWPNHSVRSDLHRPRFLTNYTEIKEDWLFLTEKIVLMKQLNLPFNLMLHNDFFQCIYIMEGNAVLDLDQEKKRLRKGDFFMIFPGVRHLLNTDEGSIAVNILIQKKHLCSEKFHVFEKYSIVNNGQSLSRAFDDVSYQPNDTTYILFHTLENPSIRNIVLHMFVEYLQKLNYKDMILDSYLTLLFAYLMRYKSEQIEISSSGSATKKVFNTIYQYCQMNLEHASLDKASCELNYSKQYIGRVVKEITGNTFNAMLTGLKLDSVKKYLLETQLSLTYIAELAGFSDASHLSRVFKAHEGVSPSVYRNRKHLLDNVQGGESE